MIPRLARFPHPAYLRLGRCEKSDGVELPPYAPWRQLVPGDGPVVLVVGPLVGGLLAEWASRPHALRPDLWVLSELPVEANPVPDAFLASLERSRGLLVVEEHVAQGGAGQMIARFLLLNGIRLGSFEHACAQGYPSGRYGSQAFHRAESGLDPRSLDHRLERLQS